MTKGASEMEMSLSQVKRFSKNVRPWEAERAAEEMVRDWMPEDKFIGILPGADGYHGPRVVRFLNEEGDEFRGEVNLLRCPCGAETIVIVFDSGQGLTCKECGRDYTINEGGYLEDAMTGEVEEAGR